MDTIDCTDRPNVLIRCCISTISRIVSCFRRAVIPSRGLNLSLDPDKFQVALKWWLGMDTSSQLLCLYCPDHQLDPLGHHAVTCKGCGDVVLRHNSLRDVFAQFCHRARLGGQLEVGHGYGAESSLSRLADILVPNWMIGKPAAFDLTVVSLLNSTTLNEAGARSGSPAGKAEVRKHNANDAKCTELGWICIPLAVETYGCGVWKLRVSFLGWLPVWICSCRVASQRPLQASIRD